MKNFILFTLIFFTLSLTIHSQCLTATYGLYPSTTFNPTCGASCIFQSITTLGYGSEYSNVNVVTGNTYKFKSSVTTDFITISNSAGTIAYSSGLSGAGGITWVSTVTATVRFYTHTNSACGSASVSRTRSICCVGAAPVAPANDLVCNAITISCGSTTSGTTVNSTTTGTYEGVTTCGVSQSMPAVWYKIIGNGQLMSASLCGTAWDSKLSIFSGATCTALTCTGGNDDNGPSCTTSTSASYQWSSINGTTYWIKVYGYSTNAAFSLSLTCVTPPIPSNNDCTNATSITLQCPGFTTLTSGTTIGASEDAIAKPTCDNVGTIQDVWYTFNTGNNNQIDITAALGTASWLGVEIYTSCGALAAGLSVVCDFNILSPNPTTITGFSMNTTYCLRIFTNTTYNTPGTFTIRLNTIANTLTLSSGSSTQIACENIPTSTITYNTTGAVNAIFSQLPAGVTGSWTNNMVTISGTPTTAGTYNYIVTLTGGCGTAASNGTYTINPALGIVNGIIGNANIIAGTMEAYSITSVSGSPTYQWDYLDGPFSSWVSGISLTNTASISWPQNSTTGAQVRVTVSNSCGFEQRILSIAVNGALPVELMFFEGKKLINSNMLYWSTASEHNSSHFIVEKSEDGYSWRSIGQIPTSINSTQQLDYSILDNNILPSINYYRLHQYDVDGNNEIFGPIMIDNRGTTKTIVKTINLAGQEVGENATGMVIEIYEDKSIKRIIK